MANVTSVQIVDPDSGYTAEVDANGRVHTKTEIGFSGDIQLGAVEIKDRNSDNRADVYQDTSGDYGLAVVPMSVTPLHSSQVNPSYVLTRNASQQVTKIEMAIVGTTYTQDLSRDASGDVVGVGAWY